MFDDATADLPGPLQVEITLEAEQEVGDSPVGDSINIACLRSLRHAELLTQLRTAKSQGFLPDLPYTITQANTDKFLAAVSGSAANASAGTTHLPAGTAAGSPSPIAVSLSPAAASPSPTAASPSPTAACPSPTAASPSPAAGSGGAASPSPVAAMAT